MKRMRILHFGFFDNQCIPTRSKHLESSNEIHFYIAHEDVSMLKLFHWHICGRLDIHQINAASKWVNQMNLQICSPRLMVWSRQSRVIVCTCMCYRLYPCSRAVSSFLKRGQLLCPHTNLSRNSTGFLIIRFHPLLHFCFYHVFFYLFSYSFL